MNDHNSTKIRINKFLAEYSGYSRRKNEECIREGLVKINGKTALLGEFMDPNKDIVTLKGNHIKPRKQLQYILLNKPVNVLTTTYDDRGRRTVLDLVKSTERIYPAGRLDFNSEGLVLLTNDGDLVLKITHPRSHIAKKYYVKTKEQINNTHLQKLESSLELDGIKTIPAKVHKISSNEFEITLYQGLKRQIREMCKLININIVILKRTDIGPLNIGKLKTGEYRNLSKKEENILKSL